MKKLFTNLFLSSLLFCSYKGVAQLSTTKSPASVLNSTTAVGSYSWTITTPLADCNLPQGFLFAFSKGLNLSNFSFSVPVNATIVGITANITYSSMVTGTTWTANPRDTTIKLLINGLEVGTNHATGILGTSTLTSPGSGRTKLYGTPTDTWGVSSITPGDVNSTEFGLAIYMAHYPYKNESTAILLNNSFSLTPNPTPVVTIYYTVPSTGIVQSQTSMAKIYSYASSLYLKEALTQNSDLTIYDMLGNKVYHATVEQGQKQINLESLSAGVYVYKLKVGEAILSQKIKLDQ